MPMIVKTSGQFDFEGGRSRKLHGTREASGKRRRRLRAVRRVSGRGGRRGGRNRSRFRGAGRFPGVAGSTWSRSSEMTAATTCRAFVTCSDRVGISRRVSVGRDRIADRPREDLDGIETRCVRHGADRVCDAMRAVRRNGRTQVLGTGTRGHRHPFRVAEGRPRKSGDDLIGQDTGRFVPVFRQRCHRGVRVCFRSYSGRRDDDRGG